MYYAVFLFQQAGISGTAASLLANGLQGVVLNIFTLPNMYWMDSWGRRKPMVIGGIGMGISMMLIGVLMKTMGKTLLLHYVVGADYVQEIPSTTNLLRRPTLHLHPNRLRTQQSHSYIYTS